VRRLVEAPCLCVNCGYRFWAIRRNIRVPLVGLAIIGVVAAIIVGFRELTKVSSSSQQVDPPSKTKRR